MRQLVAGKDVNTTAQESRVSIAVAKQRLVNTEETGKI
jgi:hypothetical protein